MIYDDESGRFDSILFAVVPAMAVVVLMLAGCSDPAPGEPMADPPTVSSPRPAEPVITPTHLQERPPAPAMVSVGIVDSAQERVSFQQPAYISAEVVGRDIGSVSLIGGIITEDGTRRVMVHRSVDPNLEDEEWPGNWTDGVHQIVQTWDSGGDFLFDGREGDFAILWMSDPESDTRTVHGRFRPAGAEDYVNAVLVVNTAKGAVEQLINAENGMPLAFAAADEFQLTNLILADDNTLRSESGMSLFFDDGAQLAYASRPGPSGIYFLGLGAETASGDADMALVSYSVDNDSLNPGHRTYFDPHRGFQFQYPEAWQGPEDREGLLVFTDPSGATNMSISTHPGMSGRPAVDLKNLALEAYGEVSLLYEDQVEIGRGGGLRTVYGYESATGSRTGVMLAFSQEGQAFVVDVDGPSSEEAAILDLAGVVARTWASRPVPAVDGSRWMWTVIDGLGVVVPANYHYNQMSNGWHRFAGPNDQTFVAYRAEPTGNSGLVGGMKHWMEVAGRDVGDFAVSALRTVERGNRTWARVDIEYILESGDRISGIIMSSRIGDRDLIIWMEAPADQYSQVESEVLMVAIDELSFGARP